MLSRLQTATFCLFAFFIISILHAEPAIKSGDYVAICGDSITEGKQYTVMMESYILMCAPVNDVKTVQFGWSGERAPGFLSRMKNDTLSFSPTVATTCYGMNDGGYQEINPAIEKAYRDAMLGVVKSFKEAGLRTIVVGAPGVVDSTTYKNPKVTAEVYNQNLQRLGEIGKEIAQSEGVLYADLHNFMMDVMAKAKAQKGESYSVAGARDGVHPDVNGHLVMAYSFLKALGFDGDIGTITYDAASGKAEATDGHKVAESKSGEIQLESTRYPFCFTGKKDSVNVNETAGMLPFLPFNQDLNRYMLVVKNIKAPKAKVTWGTESKEFTAEELSKGINLADEFLLNPFSVPFDLVAREIRTKQNFETTFTKGFLHSEPDLLKAMPEKADSIKKADEGNREIHKAMLERVASAKKPVAHVIKIEEVK